MPDISALLDQATPRELPVQLCLAGDLAGEEERLRVELELIGSDWRPASIAETDPRLGLVEQIEAVRSRMRGSVVEFRMRALGASRFGSLVAAHPAPEGSKEPFDAASFYPALLAACCVEPVLTVAQVGQLLDKINDGQARALFAAALSVNQEGTPLPF